MAITDIRYTVLQIVNEVQRKLGINETTTLTANKIAKELVDHLNDICADLSDFGNWMEQLATAKVTAQSSVRDYFVHTSGVIKNIGDIYLGTDRGPLTSENIQTMRILTRSTSYGTPSQYCIFGVDPNGNPMIRVHPTPNTAVQDQLFSILYYLKPSLYTTADAATLVPFPSRVCVAGVLSRYTLRESGGAQTEMFQIYQQDYMEGRRNALNRFNSDTGWEVQFTPGRTNRWRR